MKRIAVLGTGLVGGLIARDLASDPALGVVAVDRSAGALSKLVGIPRLETRVADLSDSEEIRAVVREVDAVALAVPGFLGRQALQAVLEAGKPVADISFSPENPLDLDGLAKSAGVTAVVDCGVAPGLSNLFAGRSAAELDELHSVLILVGGLPLRRVWPYEYRIVFSLTDVIEEYLRPCRYRENGVEVIRPALSEVELVDLPKVGTLEAFNTDGLRTLLRTLPARTLKEKTLRYPGHADRMRMLRETGFFEEKPVRIGDVEVVPRALTEKLLREAWRLPEGEEEITVLRVVVEGKRDERVRSTTWDLYDRTDPRTGSTSMARTTGFPCAIVARMLADGTWTRPGVHPPEILGADAKATEFILSELAERGIEVQVQ